jgi:hypothetical protein
VSLSTLLQQSAARYEAAVQRVLSQWIPDCGCTRPGSAAHCEACPCLSLFEQRVKDEITALHQAHHNDVPPTTLHSVHDNEKNCIYFSQPPL